MRILGVCGSLRKDAFNLQLLRNAAGLLDDNAAFELADWSNIPLYNQDDDNDNLPVSVQAFKRAIEAADGVLIATPEYNYSVPGGLKNAIDWASRPAYQSVFAGKPVAILSASMSPTGGCRAQAHLRNIMAGMLTPVFPAPDFCLASAQQAFDEHGQLKHDQSRRKLQRFVNDFCDWIKAH